MQSCTKMYEGEFDRKIPNVRTMHDTEKREIAIQVFDHKRKLFCISKRVEGDLNINDAFDLIENRAKEFAVSKVLWPKDDGIFEFIDKESFKKIYASKNRSLIIILSGALEKIGRKKCGERTKLLEKYHIDALTQTHYTPTKTAAEIMEKYH